MHEPKVSGLCNLTHMHARTHTRTHTHTVVMVGGAVNRKLPYLDFNLRHPIVVIATMF